MWYSKNQVMQNIFSPLEQFNTIPLVNLRFPYVGLDFSFTNSSLFMLLGTSVLLIIMYFSVLGGTRLVPTR